MRAIRTAVSHTSERRSRSAAGGRRGHKGARYRGDGRPAGATWLRQTETTAGGTAFGTNLELVVTAPEMLAPAKAAVEAVLRDVDLACSRFRQDSELVALNQGAGRRVPISPLLALALKEALRAAELTGGAVDPTVGGALRQLGYDDDFAVVRDRSSAVSDRLSAFGDQRSRGRQLTGSRAETDEGGDMGFLSRRSIGFVEARASGADPSPVTCDLSPEGWRAVELDADNLTVRIPEGMELDLGATAKALAADLAAEAALGGLPRDGVLISLGGDIAMRGRTPDGGWRVLLAEDSGASLDGLGTHVVLHGGGIASSNARVRAWEHSHHIVDPRTGRPAAEVWRLATVIAPTCLEANIASTAAIVRGREIIPWLEERGLAARLVASDGGVTTTTAWSKTSGTGHRSEESVERVRHRSASVRFRAPSFVRRPYESTRRQPMTHHG